jgi:hypothetical protein
MERMPIANRNSRLQPEELIYGTQHVARLLVANSYRTHRPANVIHGTRFVMLLLINLWAFITADTGLRT